MYASLDTFLDVGERAIGHTDHAAADQAGVPYTEADQFGSLPRLAYVSSLFIFGTLATLITPALLNGWQAKFGWSDTQLGEMASVELAATGVSALTAIYWQKRWNWRAVTLTGLLMVILANALCVPASGFRMVFAARILSGLGGGLLTGIYMAFLANTRVPDRFISATIFVQLAIQGLVIAVSARLLKSWGIDSIYAVLAGTVAVVLPFLPLLPIGWPAETNNVSPARGAAAKSPNGVSLAGLLVLFSFLPFDIFQGGIFAFLTNFGTGRAGMSSTQAIAIIGTSAIGSAAGPLAAFVLNERAGLFLPLALSLLIEIVVMLAMTIGHYTSPIYLLYISLLQAAWLFANCYLYTAIIKVNNVLTVAATPLSALGWAMGATLVGYAIQHAGLAGETTVAVISLVLTAACTLPFVTKRQLLARGG